MNRVDSDLSKFDDIVHHELQVAVYEGDTEKVRFMLDNLIADKNNETIIIFKNFLLSVSQISDVLLRSEFWEDISNTIYNLRAELLKK